MANVGGWMTFVDGENFTLRAQELARREGIDLSADPAHHLQDVFAWIPEFGAINGIYTYQLFPLEQPLATRAYYYTSVTGAESTLLSVKQRLRDLGFDPLVFKKPSGNVKSKGVDITLTKDMLSHAFSDHYDDAVVVAGDGDYIPLIEEVKRQGKRVYVAFFRGEG